mgnify:CR=1 FL=1
MKNRLLIFHPYLAPYRIDLYNSLAKLFELRVVLLGSKKELATLGFNIEEVNKQAQFDYSYYFEGFRIGRHLISSVYKKEIAGFRPDIVLAHELGVNTLAAILFKPYLGYKLYITVDDSPSMARQYGKLRDGLRKYVYSHVDGVLTVNPQVNAYLEDRFGKQKIRSLYFPIIQNDELLRKKIQESEGRAQSYIRKYNLKNRRILLFVGRKEKIKAPDQLLQVFETLNIDNTVLVMIGAGSLQQSLVDFVNAHNLQNKVYVLGTLTGEDLYAWYNLADIFVLPSRFEPFGAVVNEALVAGCYTIVSDKVGAAALITEDNGYVIPSDNDMALGQAIKSILGSLPQTKNKNSKMPKSYKDYLNELLKFFVQ